MRKHSGEQEENSARVRNEGHLTHAISDTVSSRLYNACSMLSSLSHLLEVARAEPRLVRARALGGLGP